MFDSHFNAVDRMNQDYHMFFQLRGYHSVNSLVLHSASFYFLATCRAVWEEHMRVRRYAHVREAKSAWNEYTMDSLPEFIVNLGEVFDRALLRRRR